MNAHMSASLMNSLHVFMKSHPWAAPAVREALQGVVTADGIHPTNPWDQLSAVGLRERPDCTRLTFQHAVGLVFLFTHPTVALSAAKKAMHHVLKPTPPSPEGTMIPSFALVTGRMDPLDFFYSPGLEEIVEKPLPLFADQAARQGALKTFKNWCDRRTTNEATLYLGDDEGKPVASIGYRLFIPGDIKRIVQAMALDCFDDEFLLQFNTYVSWLQSQGRTPPLHPPKAGLPAVHVTLAEQRFGVEPPHTIVPRRVQGEIRTATQRLLEARLSGLRSPTSSLSSEARMCLRLSPLERMNRPLDEGFFLRDDFLRDLSGKLPTR